VVQGQRQGPQWRPLSPACWIFGLIVEDLPTLNFVYIELILMLSQLVFPICVFALFRFPDLLQCAIVC
jgi:hypothetical protein